MAVSVNGFVARQDGDEDFLPHEGWLQMLEYVKLYGHLIWGRKTYAAVKSWGGDFIKDLEGVPIIIVSKSRESYDERNVTVCQSPEEAIEIVNKRKYKKAFLSGGPSLNTSFIKADLVDEIILNYNPTILASGIELFSKSDFEIKLKLKEVHELSLGIVQMHYSVVQVFVDKAAK